MYYARHLTARAIDLQTYLLILFQSQQLDEKALKYLEIPWSSQFLYLNMRTCLECICISSREITASATFKVKEFTLGFPATASSCHLNSCFLPPQLLIPNYMRIAMAEKP